MSSNAHHDEPIAIPEGPSHPTAQGGTSDTRLLSSSFSSASHREPIRSFIHGSVRDHLGKFSLVLLTNDFIVGLWSNLCVSAPVDSASYARSVRQDTAELATYLLSDETSKKSPSFLSRTRSQSSNLGREVLTHDEESIEDSDTGHMRNPDVILEVSEPPQDSTPESLSHEGPSILASMLRRSPPEIESGKQPEEDEDSMHSPVFSDDDEEPPPRLPGSGKLPPPVDYDESEEHLETLPLLLHASASGSYVNGRPNVSAEHVDLESQKSPRPKPWSTLR